MKKGNALKGILAAGLIITSAFGLAGCGNKDIWDMHYEFNYVVIEEGDQHILHEVKSWTDAESESVTFTTDCCGNYIWTTANNAVLYRDKPSSNAYTTTCDHIHE